MHKTFEESHWSLKSLLLKLWVWYSLGGLCKDSPPRRTLVWQLLFQVFWTHTRVRDLSSGIRWSVICFYSCRYKAGGKCIHLLSICRNLHDLLWQRDHMESAGTHKLVSPGGGNVQICSLARWVLCVGFSGRGEIRRSGSVLLAA